MHTFVCAFTAIEVENTSCSQQSSKFLFFRTRASILCALQLSGHGRSIRSAADIPKGLDELFPAVRRRHAQASPIAFVETIVFLFCIFLFLGTAQRDDI